MPRPNREKHTAVFISPKRASLPYLFSDVHDNEGPDTKFSVESSKIYLRS